MSVLEKIAAWEQKVLKGVALDHPVVAMSLKDLAEGAALMKYLAERNRQEDGLIPMTFPGGSRLLVTGINEYSSDGMPIEITLTRTGDMGPGITLRYRPIKKPR